MLVSRIKTSVDESTIEHLEEFELNIRDGVVKLKNKGCDNINKEIQMTEEEWTTLKGLIKSQNI